MNNTYVIGNGKGGVGKTTTALHLAALCALDGARALVIDLNGQGNTPQLLGFANTPEDDNGLNLYQAITAGIPLKPVRDVRPNLDVVPGGDYVKKVGPSILMDLFSGEEQAVAYTALARAISPIAKDYKIIFIDTPPENQTALRLALGAGRFVVVPIKTEVGMSRKGLRELAGDVRLMREINPFLTILGGFVFASERGATKVRREAHDAIASDLGAECVFKAYIRHTEKVSQDMSKFGRLSFELEKEIDNNPTFWQLRRGQVNPADAVIISPAARGVAEDFQALAKEVLLRAADCRAAAIEKGNWP